MKKIIGILGVALITGAIFLSNNNVKEVNNTDLASLLSVGVANAEEAYFCRYTGYSFDTCTSSGKYVTGCTQGGSGCGYF